MRSDAQVAVLAIGHGTVSEFGQLPEFLTRIRGGRPPNAEVVAEFERRYRLIGGSPLGRITRELVRALSRELGLPVLLAARFATPSIADVLASAVGFDLLVLLPLAPFNLPSYTKLVEELRVVPHPELIPALPWSHDRELIKWHLEQIDQALQQFPRASVVLTLHSLPERVPDSDRYRTEAESYRRVIGDRLHRPVLLAYQSAGERGGPWLGPSLLETMIGLREQGREQVVVVPVGFVAEHLETLYDLDFEARAQAAELGLRFVRLPTPNTAPCLVRALARAVEGALANRGQPEVALG